MVGHSGTYYNVGILPLLPPLNRTAGATSASVDTQNYDSVAFAVNVGATGDTLSGTNRVELQVQESDDNSTFTAVANADLNNYAAGTTNTGTTQKIIANAGAAQAYLVGYKGYKRYIRGVVNVTGTHTNGTIVAVTGVRGRNHLAPVNANT